MIKYVIFFCCFLVLTNAYAQKRSDGYDKLNRKEKDMIHSFSGNHIIGKAGGLNDTVIIETISADQVRQLIPKQEFTWLNMCNSACGSCQVNEPRYMNMVMDFPQLNLILVDIDFSPKKLRKRVLESNYRGTVYIIDQQIHGDRYLGKYEHFKKSLCADCKPGDITPQSMFFDRSGKLIHHKVGSGITPDSLRAYLPLSY